MTKEQLRRYRDIKRELEGIDRAIDRINSDLYNPRSVEISGMPKGSPAGGNSHLDALLDKKAELLRVYGEKKAELQTTILAIERAIDSLEPRERTVLRLYYIEGLKWEEVCVRGYFSWRTVHRIHAEALEKLKSI